MFDHVYACRIDLFRIFPVIDVTTSHTLTCSHTLILNSVFGNGTYFPRDSFVHQREPLSKFFLKCVFWLPLSNEGSHRCSGVFVFEIIAFKFFNFLLQHLVTCGTIFSISRMLSIYLRDKAISNILICSTYMTFLKCF